MQNAQKLCHRCSNIGDRRCSNIGYRPKVPLSLLLFILSGNKSILRRIVSSLTWFIIKIHAAGGVLRTRGCSDQSDACAACSQLPHTRALVVDVHAVSSAAGKHTADRVAQQQRCHSTESDRQLRNDQLDNCDRSVISASICVNYNIENHVFSNHLIVIIIYQATTKHSKGNGVFLNIIKHKFALLWGEAQLCWPYVCI